MGKSFTINIFYIYIFWPHYLVPNTVVYVVFSLIQYNQVDT